MEKIIPYHSQAKCQYINPQGKKCNCISSLNSLYCRHHVKEISIPSNSNISALNNSSVTQSRYNPKSVTVRECMNNNLASPSQLDMRHEIALLQAWLQELMDAPVSNFDKQLQVIDRIEKLVTNFQRIRLSAQALAQAEHKVKLVINNVVLIIKDVVTDKEERAEIARRLAELGNAYEQQQQSAALASSVLIQEEPINAQGLALNSINTPTQAQEHAAQAPAQESGDPAPGTETAKDIPSPCPDASSTDIPQI